MTLVSSRFVIWPWLICAVYFFTGATALGYEVLWARMLSTLFGVSIFGVVVTVSAFMAGLGAGSFCGGKFQNKIRSPLLWLASIEFVVALFAFNLPALLAFVDFQVNSIASASDFSTWFVFQSIATFVLMFVPAFVLGLGFPMVLLILKSTKVPIAVVYGVNTLGGVCGALLPLLLLPAVGWVVSDRLFAILGMLLAFFLVVIHFSIRKKVFWEVSVARAMTVVPVVPLLAYAGVGASAIMLQIAWARLYGMVLLRTEYVMAIILATFLIGIGIGSLLSSKFQYKSSVLFYSLVVSVCALGSLYTLPVVSAWAESAVYHSLSESMITQALVIGLCTLPATLVFGAWFPLLSARYNSERTMSAYLYGANSLGAALGGLIAGFVILPFFGSTVVIIVAVLFLLVSSLAWVQQKWFKLLPLIAITLFIPVMSFPVVEALLPASQKGAKDLSFYEDAISLTQVVEEVSGQRVLLSDLQRMDASTDPTAVIVQKNQARLPLLLHPDPETILFLGLGTGITASGSLPYPELERTSVEISQGAIDAAGRYFSLSNEAVISQMTIYRDDARRYLKVTDKYYDVIVGDLFHPDMVGRSTLLSFQQFERAKFRLADDGVFVQWVSLNQFDLKTLQVVLKTFKEVFPEAVIFMDGFRLGLVGFKGDFGGVPAFKSSLSALSFEQRSEVTGGEGMWTWIGRYWGRIPDLDVSVQDEWAPVIEFQLPKAKFNRQIDLSELINFLANNRPSIAVAAVELKVGERDRHFFSQVYEASEIYAHSWLALFSGQHQKSQELLSLAYSMNPDNQWAAFGLADAIFASIDSAIQQGYSELEILGKVLEISPKHIDALVRLQLLHLRLGSQEEAAKIEAQLKVLSPLLKER